jgi:hypothetical protein
MNSKIVSALKMSSALQEENIARSQRKLKAAEQKADFLQKKYRELLEKFQKEEEKANLLSVELESMKVTSAKLLLGLVHAVEDVGQHCVELGWKLDRAEEENHQLRELLYSEDSGNTQAQPETPKPSTSTCRPPLPSAPRPITPTPPPPPTFSPPASPETSTATLPHQPLRQSSPRPENPIPTPSKTSSPNESPKQREKRPAARRFLDFTSPPKKVAKLAADYDSDCEYVSTEFLTTSPQPIHQSPSASIPDEWQHEWTIREKDLEDLHPNNSCKSNFFFEM